MVYHSKVVSPVRKQIIGIIGGMCSGKSTAASEFGKFGCAVIDADGISHEALLQQDVKAKIVRLFGKDVLDEKGEIDRAILADKVFSDVGKLASLRSVLYPIVFDRVEQLISQYNGKPEVKAIVLDIPLLVEVGWENRCDHVIFIDCKGPLRLERAKKTGFFDADQLKVRENLQISLDRKKLIADNVVDNNSDLAGLSRQIAEIFSNIINKG